MPLDRPLPDEPREALKMLWSVAEEQQVDIYRHRDSIHKVWHVAPAKPREGMLVYADGTDWNPGSGAGYYVYYAGAWHPMGGSGPAGPAGPPGATGPPGSTGPPGASTIIQEEGVPLTNRTKLNFIGTSVTAVDDAVNSRTNVTITSIGQTPWLSDINAASFKLNSAGGIGIGVGASASMLHVLNGANDTDAIRVSGASGSQFMIFQANAGAGRIMHWNGTGFGNIIFNPSGGSIGIGTTGPFSKLSFGSNAPNVTQRMAFYENPDGSNYYGVGMANPTGGFGVAIWTSVSPSDSNPRMIVRDSGNVGIGTTAPGSKLSVVGLPTSSAGLTTGDIWVDVAGGKVLKIV